MFEGSEDAVFLVDGKGLIQKANPVAIELLGMPEDRIVNQTFEGLFAAQPTDFLPDPESGSEEWRILRNGYGSLVPVAVRSTPIKSRRGKVQGSVVTLRDIRCARWVEKSDSSARPLNLSEKNKKHGSE